MSWQWKMMQNMKRNWLFVWNLSPQLDTAFKCLKNLHFNGILLTKIYTVWAKKAQKNLMTLKIERRFESKSKLTCSFKTEMRNLVNAYRVKNSYSILEIKRTELNQNKNSKQGDLPDVVRKLWFTLAINK